MLLYIDPGTGSMLFSILIGLATTAVFFFRKLFIKIKYTFTGKKANEIATEKVPYLIFSDHKRYWNVFKPICDEFENRSIDVDYWTMSKDDPVFSAGYTHIKAKFIGEGNIAFARLNAMNVGIVLSTTPGLDVLQWKRSKNVDYYVHIWHTVDEGLGYRMFGIDHYDSILLSGEFQSKYIRQIENLRKLPAKELVVVGCPYLDSMKNRLTTERKVANTTERTVLLAPSWGESSILNRYGETFIDSLIATGYNIIVRPHPQSMASEKDLMTHLMSKYKDGDKFSWNFDNDNFDVLNKSDIMITDFSGIIFDYTFIFDKPLIYADTSFDTAPYDAAWIEDEPLWRFEVLKKLGVKLKEKDFSRMKEVIDSTIASSQFAEGRKEVSAQAWQNKGECAKSVVDYLTNKAAELKEKATLPEQKYA